MRFRKFIDGYHFKMESANGGDGTGGNGGDSGGGNGEGAGKGQESGNEGDGAGKGGSGTTAFYKTQAESLRKDLSAKDAAIADLQKQLEQRETGELEKKKEFEKLWQQEKEKREKAESNLSNFQKGYISQVKDNEVQNLAVSMGMDKKYLQYLKVDEAIVKHEVTESGRVLTSGAKEFVEAFKAENPIFFSTNSMNINNGGGGTPPGGEGGGKTKFDPEKYSGDGAGLTGPQLLALQKKNPEKYSEVVQNRLKS